MDNETKPQRGRPRSAATKLPAPKPLLPLDAERTGELRDAAAVERQAAVARNMAARTVQAATDDVLPYGIQLAEVDRMAQQFMRRADIAAVIGIPDKVFADCLGQFPPLRHAFERGAALTLDKASANIMAAVLAGDLGASRFVLERKGGWTAPTAAPVIVVQSAAGLTIDGEHIADLAGQQRQLREIPEAELVD